MTLSSNAVERFAVVDRYCKNRSFKLLDLVYSDTLSRSDISPPLESLPPPDLPEPDLPSAERDQITFAGGAMGGLRSARIGGEKTGIRQLAREKIVWAISGVVATRHDEPLWSGCVSGTRTLSISSTTARSATRRLYTDMR